MEEKIKNNLDNPAQLEKLYRENKNLFKKAFNTIYPEIEDQQPAQIWYQRLNYDSKEVSWGTRKEMMVTLLIALLAGVIAKLPDFFSLDHEHYYTRNISLVVFPMLAAWFAWKQCLPPIKMIIISGIILISAIYINILPQHEKSDTLVLACIYLPLFLYTVLGYAYTGLHYRSHQSRIEFLRYNGDLLVMTAIILIAGGLLSAVTIGLFGLIGLKIEEFYFKNVVIWGLAATPVISTYLIQVNPQLVKNVSPVVARVFTPLVLITLLIYLAAIMYTGKDPYNDREFLVIFNLLLVGVMAVIFFSVAESSQIPGNSINILLLFILSIVTIILNITALTAIIYRIFSWGTTPNRLTVLGGNILILINLIIISFRLLQSIKLPSALPGVEKSIAVFLPVYSAWTLVVSFLFPVMFNFN